MAAGNPLARIMDWFNAQDVNEEEMEEMEPIPPQPAHDAQQKRQRGPLVLRPTAEGGMEIRHPRNLDDRMAIGMDLKQRRTVALDLTKMPDGEARYFLEFIYGVVFALDATAVKITDGIYLLAPRGVAVRNDAETGETDSAAGILPRINAAATGRGTQEELFWQS